MTIKLTIGDRSIFLDDHVKDWLDDNDIKIKWDAANQYWKGNDRNLLHQIWEQFIGRPDFAAAVRHANREPNDFRLNNIQVVPWKEVLYSRKPYGKQGLYGVQKPYNRNKYRVFLKGKPIGRFATKEEAAEAHDRAATAMFGEDYPCLNRNLKK